MNFDVSEWPVGQLIGGKLGIVHRCESCGKGAALRELARSRRFVHTFSIELDAKRNPKLTLGQQCKVKRFTEAAA